MARAASGTSIDSSKPRVAATSLERWPLDRLIPYARNARTHSDEQVAQIAASIREFGFVNPILAGSDSVIIAGHGRLLAAQKLGMTEVPVIVIDSLTENQRRALIIADNKLTLNAGWDEELLRLEIEALREVEYDLHLIGFDDRELADLLAQQEAAAGFTDEDAVPELQESPITVTGDLWRLGDHRVLCGEPMLLLRSADLPDDAGWIRELKYDGFRGIAFKTGGTVHLRSRDDKDFSFRYPAVTKALSKLPDETVIDGEVVAFDEEGRPSFNVLQNYGSSGAPIFYFVFDLLILSGEDVMDRPLHERRELLEGKVLSKLSEPIRYSGILSSRNSHPVI